MLWIESQHCDTDMSVATVMTVAIGQVPQDCALCALTSCSLWHTYTVVRAACHLRTPVGLHDMLGLQWLGCKTGRFLAYKSINS